MPPTFSHIRTRSVAAIGADFRSGGQSLLLEPSARLWDGIDPREPLSLLANVPKSGQRRGHNRLSYNRDTDLYHLFSRRWSYPSACPAALTGRTTELWLDAIP
jgi:hypothetical protein